MKRITALIAVLSLTMTVLMAQTVDLNDLDFKTLDNPGDTYTIFETTSEETITEESEEEGFVYAPNQKGDQFVRLNLALEVPVRPKQLSLGGTGTLSYGMFLSEDFSLSGKVSFAYSTTVGSNVFYFIPVTLCAQYQMMIRNLEIPLSIEIGGAIQSYIDRLYFGLVVKPEAGFFYRIAPDWSVGTYAGLYIMPQWYKDSANNYTGVISDIGLSVRYHF